MPFFADWITFEAFLDAKGLFHIELGLERMRKGMAMCGFATLPFSAIQVLGTNGKGSTAAFLDSLARAHGLKTGLFTSPHFVSPKERIQVNGRWLSDEIWLAAANRIAESRIPDLTYFEFLALLALEAFKREKVDLAIFEAGLGGASDATTAVPAITRCFAPIALDHAAIIGPGLADIARDKAAAITANDRIFSAPQFPVAARELARAAREKSAALSFIQPLENGEKLGLSGEHQKTNAALALAAWRYAANALGVAGDPENCAAGLAGAFIPGRMQFIPANAGHPSLVLDGAHNPHGASALVQALRAGGIVPGGLVFSCLGDKDWRPGLAMLVRYAQNAPVRIVELENARAASGAEIAAFCASMGANAEVFRGRDALKNTLASLGDHENVLLAGSLYLLGAFFALYPAYLRQDS